MTAPVLRNWLLVLPTNSFFFIRHLRQFYSSCSKKQAEIGKFCSVGSQNVSQRKPAEMPNVNNITYPRAPRDETVFDNYFGIEVKDPYRWLENPESEETKKFVEEQNTITRQFLDACPYRGSIKKSLTAMWDYPKYSCPFREGNNYFFFKNTGLQNQSADDDSSRQSCPNVHQGERTGIYQSIGFKEFYDFLTMNDETRESKEGKEALEKGVTLLKIATRQYAKRQQKWIKNRFLRNGLRQIPPIYGLDATDVSKWKENVYSIAEDVVKCHLEGTTPSLEPLPVENTKEVIDRLYTCECGTILQGKTQYEDHLKSNKHNRKMRRKIRLEKKESIEAVESNS